MTATRRRPAVAALCAILLSLAVPTSAGARTFVRDVEYGTAAGERLLLDISIPEGEGPFPVAILVHGGGWGGGDKAGGDIAPWFQMLNDAGFAWFSINYRLAPAHRWPAAIEDVRTAIRWIKENASRHGGDPERIALFGHSAGGHLAFLAAVQADDATRVQAAVGYAPVTDFEQELPVRGGLSKALRDLHDRPHELTDETLALLRDTAPINHLKPGLVPFLVVHGDRDRTVPLQQSLNFQARVRSTMNTCDLLVIPEGEHRLNNWSQLDPDYPARVVHWLRERLAAPDAATTSAPRALTPAARPVVAAPEAGPPAGGLRLWYRQPARHWTEALPVGGGRLGAMIFGGTAEERLQLNDDTLWSGGPHAYHHEGAVGHLPELRRLLAEGRQREAETLATATFMSVPLRQQAYQPLGDILLSFPGHESVTHYQRELDLDQALVTSTYRTPDGTTYERSAFASHPDRVIVQRIGADRPGAVSFTVRAASPHPASQARPVDATTWLLTGRVAFGGTRFAGAVRVLADGAGARVETTPTGIRVTNADAATVLVTAATSFVNFHDVSGAPEPAALGHLDSASRRGLDSLLSRHVADHTRLFRRMAFELDTPATTAEPTDERLLLSDPSLVQLLFQFGRYLLIASSRGDDQPANLQGNWNEYVNPPWGGKYTVNINTEMNYWPAEVGNLPESAEPLFRMIEDLAQSGRETARAHYGARGWVLHHNTDLWRGTAPINASNHGIWPTGGAWLCQHLWERWRFSRDRAFLERAYPILHDAALFFVDYLVEDPRSGWLISGPSNSPEHGGLVMGPAMDHQIIRGLFEWTASAARELGRDAEFAAQLDTMRARIAPNQIGRHGQLQEWLEDKDDPRNRHRHISHLWGVFPGEDITTATPGLLAAARQSLLFRGDEGTGWSLGWKIAFWARFLDGDRAHRMILQQLRPVDGAATGVRTSSVGGGSYFNLFGAHPPFQIDGNFGLTASVCEMLVQSHTAEIVLLPALPSAWPSGSLRGVRAREGFELDLVWRDSALHEVVVRSRLGRPLRLRHGSHTRELVPAAGSSTRLDGRLTVLSP